MPTYPQITIYVQQTPRGGWVWSTDSEVKFPWRRLYETKENAVDGAERVLPFSRPIPSDGYDVVEVPWREKTQ